MDDVAGAEAVGGNEDFLVHAGAEQVDGHHRGAGRGSIRVERLAEQHFATLQRRMAVAAHSMADDLGGDHWIEDCGLLIEDWASRDALSFLLSSVSKSSVSIRPCESSPCR